jgi:hypothetical protein
MKKVKRNPKNYTEKIDQACKNAPYLSTNKSGKGKGGGFGDYDLTQWLMELTADVALMRGWWEALGLVCQEELDKLNIRNSKSLLNNAWRMMDKSELIIDDIPTTNLEVVGEYVQKFMVLGKIYRGELTEEEERYFKVGALKFINGELIKDEEKYNLAMMAVL